MIKALHGTHSGGARWHDRLFDILQELKFKPSKADPDVWMRPEPGGTCYEYIAVYGDDLAIAAKDPQAFCNELKKRYNLKLKGVGPLEYHLGYTYNKDPDGTLAADPRRYVNCWKPSSLLSNVHFRNTTKIAVQVLLLLTLFTFTFEPFLKL